MTVVLIESDAHTGGMPNEHEDRDRGAVPTSQGMAKTASQPPGARTEAWNLLSLAAFRGSQ